MMPVRRLPCLAHLHVYLTLREADTGDCHLYIRARRILLGIKDAFALLLTAGRQTDSQFLSDKQAYTVQLMSIGKP